MSFPLVICKHSMKCMLAHPTDTQSHLGNTYEYCARGTVGIVQETQDMGAVP